MKLLRIVTTLIVISFLLQSCDKEKKTVVLSFEPITYSPLTVDFTNSKGVNQRFALNLADSPVIVIEDVFPGPCHVRITGWSLFPKQPFPLMEYEFSIDGENLDQLGTLPIPSSTGYGERSIDTTGSTNCLSYNTRPIIYLEGREFVLTDERVLYSLVSFWETDTEYEEIPADQCASNKVVSFSVADSFSAYVLEVQAVPSQDGVHSIHDEKCTLRYHGWSDLPHFKKHQPEIFQ